MHILTIIRFWPTPLNIHQLTRLGYLNIILPTYSGVFPSLATLINRLQYKTSNALFWRKSSCSSWLCTSLSATFSPRNIWPKGFNQIQRRLSITDKPVYCQLSQTNFVRTRHISKEPKPSFLKKKKTGTYILMNKVTGCKSHPKIFFTYLKIPSLQILFYYFREPVKSGYFQFHPTLKPIFSWK